MEQQADNKKAVSDDLGKIIGIQILNLFRSSQAVLMISINSFLIFSIFFGLISLILVNSGDVIIKFIEFIIKISGVRDGKYSGHFDLKGYVMPVYALLTLLVYLTQKIFSKIFRKKLKVTLEKKLLFASIFVILGYFLLMLLFSFKYISIFFGLAFITLIINWYYLILSFGLDKLIKGTNDYSGNIGRI